MQIGRTRHVSMAVLMLFEIASFASGVGACRRPVDGRDQATSIVTDLRAEPPYVRERGEAKASFQLRGAPAASIRCSLGTFDFDCNAEIVDERHVFLLPPAIVGEIGAGSNTLAVEATDAEGPSTRPSHEPTQPSSTTRIARRSSSSGVAASSMDVSSLRRLRR